MLSKNIQKTILAKLTSWYQQPPPPDHRGRIF